MSPQATAYLREAITALRTQHINRDKIDWDKTSSEAFGMVSKAQTPADTYPAIEFIIKRLGEKHTFLIPAVKEKEVETGKTSTGKATVIDLSESEQLRGGVTILRLPAFMGSQDQGIEYADTLRHQLRAAERASTCGYIVDLRYNGGGNMWPMLNGLGGLFRDGRIGAFDKSDDSHSYWVSRSGRIDNGEPSEKSGFGKPLALRRPDAPVAVLIGRYTLSSGEFTAMAFQGRQRTRFFGSPTGGYISVNSSVKLSDGAVIAMTTGWGSDRTGKQYTKPMEPDLATQGGAPTLNAALAWLKTQGCGSKTSRT